MTAREKETAPSPRERLARARDVYGRLIAVLMMLLGLRQWAIIVGLLEGPAGTFEEMPMAWKLATIHLAIVDLVASVGLWQRVAWGNVVWVYAAVSAIAMHTVFSATFGGDLLVVGAHAATLSIYLALYILERKAEGF